ncbi:beta-lactamase family protein [bacterium]|nr:beta-lactamase family protein [bacterium]
MLKIKYLILVLFLIGIPIVNAQPVDSVPTTGTLPSELKPFDKAVRSILAYIGAPGAAFAVARNGRLVLSRGYGYADSSAGKLVQPTSLFRIASVSKPITAATVLKLVDEGRLSLDDHMLDLLALQPPVGMSLDPRMREITVQDLLYHAGGWDREASGFDPMFAAARIPVAMDERPPASAETIIRFMLGQPLDFDPGTRQAYSNLGYAVLGRVIEAVTGERYEDYVHQAVLEPSGAVQIRMGRSLLEHQAEGEVHYHDPRRVLTVFPGTGVVPAPYGAFAIEAMDAHGGWVASAPDLLRFLTAVDLSPSRPDLLPSEILRTMSSPHETAKPDSTYYAMGWELKPTESGAVWYHRGDLPGTTALLTCAGRTQFALLLNGNAGSRENAERMLPTLLRAAEAIESWPKLDLFSQLK